MSPQATARLRILRDVGVLRLQPRTAYVGIDELARDGLIECRRGRDGGINCMLTDFGRDLAATIPQEKELG